jgi:hypothetical protein
MLCSNTVPIHKTGRDGGVDNEDGSADSDNDDYVRVKLTNGSHNDRKSPATVVIVKVIDCMQVCFALTHPRHAIPLTHLHHVSHHATMLTSLRRGMTCLLM